MAMVEKSGDVRSLHVFGPVKLGSAHDAGVMTPGVDRVSGDLSVQPLGRDKGYGRKQSARRVLLQASRLLVPGIRVERLSGSNGADFVVG